MVLELIAVLCTGLFAGAAIYITLVEHPARLECGAALALTEFRPSYRRAAVLQATLAAVGCLAAVGAWMQGRSLLVRPLKRLPSSPGGAPSTRCAARSAPSRSGSLSST